MRGKNGKKSDDQGRPVGRRASDPARSSEPFLPARPFAAPVPPPVARLPPQPGEGRRTSKPREAARPGAPHSDKRAKVSKKTTRTLVQGGRVAISAALTKAQLMCAVRLRASRPLALMSKLAPTREDRDVCVDWIEKVAAALEARGIRTEEMARLFMAAAGVPGVVMEDHHNY